MPESANALCAKAHGGLSLRFAWSGWARSGANGGRTVSLANSVGSAGSRLSLPTVVGWAIAVACAAAGVRAVASAATPASNVDANSGKPSSAALAGALRSRPPAARTPALEVGAAIAVAIAISPPPAFMEGPHDNPCRWIAREEGETEREIGKNSEWWLWGTVLFRDRLI